MVLCQGACRRKRFVLLQLSSGSEAQQRALERGQELGAGPFLTLSAIHPCFWSAKEVCGGSALSLHWQMLQPEEKGKEALSPWCLPPEVRRTEVNIALKEAGWSRTGTVASRTQIRAVMQSPRAELPLLFYHCLTITWATESALTTAKPPYE